MTPRNDNTNLSNSLLPLTLEEKSIICGTMLGDGHIQKRGLNSYRFKIDHSLEQKEYVMWKHDKLKRLCTTTQPPKITKDKKGNLGIEFYTSSGLYLKDFHEKFYVPTTRGSRTFYEKRINEELIAWLPKNPLVLLTWFLDDGSVRNDCYAGKIATQGFTREGNELLREYLASCGVVGTKLVRHTEASGQYYLSLPATNNTFGQLIDLIGPIVKKEVPSLVYKLNEQCKPRND